MLIVCGVYFFWGEFVFFVGFFFFWGGRFPVVLFLVFFFIFVVCFYKPLP